MLAFTEFTKRLALGQLKNTSAVNENYKDDIDEDSIAEILSLTNQGLVDLSTKFALFTRQIDLVFQTDVHTYSMVSDGVGTYLDESLTEPFIDDFVKILSVTDAYGRDHPIDTNGHIMTPKYNSLRFTTAKMTDLGERVRILYQANHPVIIKTEGVYNDIELPPNLETALQLFVASLYLSHMNSKEHTEKGDKYFAVYLRHIGDDESKNNSSTSDVDEDTRFGDRGFV